MHRLAVLALMLPSSSIASDPFECVDPDFFEAFVVGRSSTPPTFSTSVPDQAESLDLPSSMELIGSRTQGSSTTVVYKTDQQAEAAFSTITSVLSANGWKDVSDAHQPARRGFQTPRKPKSATFCRDTDPAHLSVVANDKSGPTYVSVTQYSQRELYGCSGNARSHRRHNPSELMSRLPILNLPEGATSSNVGMGGNGDEVNSRVDVSNFMGREDLLSYFGDQIRDQDWVFETTWSSSQSSGSVWTLSTSEDGILIGTLHVYDSGADPIRVRFSINPADPTKGTDGGSWSSTTIDTN